ncbi:MAG TPA: hypothetical protein VGH74_16460 [Planctomycetaceae bacterium]
MARWHILLAGLLALLALGSGCAMNRPGNPFAKTSGKPSAAQMAKKSAKNDATAGDKNAALAAANGPKSAADEDDPNGPSSASAAAKAARDGGHDPETMAYIDQQLRDATPEERTELLAALKGLSPSAVRQILRNRRMGINDRRQEELAWQRNGRSARPETILPAGGESAAGAGHTYPTNGSPNESVATRNGLPVGHSSAYRADGVPANPNDTGHAAVPPGPAGRGPANTAGGQPPANQQIINQAVVTDAAAIARDMPIRPAAISIGVPMNAGSVPATAGDASSGDGSTREQLARLISAMETEAFAEQPGETEAEKLAFIKKQVDLRMLYLISGQHERALQAIPGVDPADQEFWQQEFWGHTNYFDVGSMPSSNERAAQTVTQLTNAVLRLQEKASLELRNVTFCHKISNFGNFEKYPREEFSPGQEVLLYAEVANIHSEPIPDGKFRTSLKSTIEVYHHGAQGQLIERIDLPEAIDICRTHRRDYFHSYQYTIPAKLALGPHLLKLTVEDQLSRRVATYTLNFTVK